ncbi:hypothetical protein GCM10023193_44290 [Planotetraspora kaengkrachanensis]|uniref:Uncharacterized protein n=1 Tax=Planotetraspora kaengkrachanensis TaxID=575193 RepID=A0A8J3PYD1_9ACTN|nr:hypothetical protein Pka01_65280 [Planotetraspora kaengkrachanensis]
MLRATPARLAISPMFTRTPHPNPLVRDHRRSNRFMARRGTGFRNEDVSRAARLRRHFGNLKSLPIDSCDEPGLCSVEPVRRIGST